MLEGKFCQLYFNKSEISSLNKNAAMLELDYS